MGEVREPERHTRNYPWNIDPGDGDKMTIISYLVDGQKMTVDESAIPELIGSLVEFFFGIPFNDEKAAGYPAVFYHANGVEPPP